MNRTAFHAELCGLRKSGVILLKVCVFEMPSYTYAVKGEKLLRSRGYTCKIKRKDNSSAGGCGFSLYVSERCRSAAEILDNYSIPYTFRVYGGG